MDNLPRLQPGYDVANTHGHMVWVDACLQELMDCRILIEMGKILGREEDTAELLRILDRMIELEREEKK